MISFIMSCPFLIVLLIEYSFSVILTKARRLTKETHQTACYCP